MAKKTIRKSLRPAPREIVFLYSDISERVTRLVFSAVASAAHPLSKRNLRWWSGNTQAFRFVVTIGIPREKAPTASNCIHHSYAGYAAHYRLKRHQKEEATPMAQYQEESAARLAFQIEEWLNSL